MMVYANHRSQGDFFLHNVIMNFKTNFLARYSGDNPDMQFWWQFQVSVSAIRLCGSSIEAKRQILKCKSFLYVDSTNGWIRSSVKAQDLLFWPTQRDIECRALSKWRVSKLE